MRLRVPSLRLHKPSGLAVVRFKGKDYYCGRFGTEQAKQRYEALVIEHLQRVPVPLVQQAAGDPNLTVEQVIAAFWDEHSAQLTKPNGKLTPNGSHFQLVLRSWRFTHGAERVADFGPLAFRSWLTFATAFSVAIDADGTRRAVKRERALAIGTAKDWASRLRGVLRWAVENELIADPQSKVLFNVEAKPAPIRAGPIRARLTERVRPVPDHHVQAVLPYLRPVARDIVVLLRLTAARCGELLAMRPCNLGPGPEGTIIYRPQQHKTLHRGMQREIVLDAAAQQVLAPYLRDRVPDSYVFSPQEAEAQRNAERSRQRKLPRWHSHDPRRRRTKRGAPRKLRDCYDTPAIARAIKRACAAAKAAGLAVEPWTVHRLRHAAARELRARFGIDTARAALGHSSPDVTSIYAETDTKTVAAAVTMIDRSAWLRAAGRSVGGSTSSATN